jgi:hypothetical protein
MLSLASPSRDLDFRQGPRPCKPRDTNGSPGRERRLDISALDLIERGRLAVEINMVGIDRDDMFPTQANSVQSMSEPLECTGISRSGIRLSLAEKRDDARQKDSISGDHRISITKLFLSRLYVGIFGQNALLATGFYHANPK